MESEHGLISSLLEWAGRRVDGARMAEAVAEGLGGAQIPSVPFTSGSPQGDMDVSFFYVIFLSMLSKVSIIVYWELDIISSNCF
jgi:hypothetical protein